MPYLIDGHNLIPKIAGLSLRALDDEEMLLEKLQTFARMDRRSVEVVFDRAAPGHAGKRRFGQVTAYFVPAGTTADQKIIARLRRLGRAARNWTVVSSDHWVQNEARALHAQVITSEAFASQLRRLDQAAPSTPEDRETSLDDEEIRQWMRLFSGEEDKRTKKD